MITIVFPDKDTENKAIGFLLGRFSGRVLRSGEHIVPEAALPALAQENLSFTVLGRATHEQLTSPFKPDVKKGEKSSHVSKVGKRK